VVFPASCIGKVGRRISLDFITLFAGVHRPIHFVTSPPWHSRRKVYISLQATRLACESVLKGNASMLSFLQSFLNVSVQQVGGLVHWRVGRVGGSFYVSSPVTDRARTARLVERAAMAALVRSLDGFNPLYA
jgi:hypothetical protein